eukprot:8095829-Alexandrium_andersonii.AAC.1
MCIRDSSCRERGQRHAARCKRAWPTPTTPTLPSAGLLLPWAGRRICGGAARGHGHWQTAPPQTPWPATGIGGATLPTDITARRRPALQVGVERRRERKEEEAGAD